MIRELQDVVLSFLTQCVHCRRYFVELHRMRHDVMVCTPCVLQTGLFVLTKRYNITSLCYFLEM